VLLQAQKAAEEKARKEAEAKAKAEAAAAAKAQKEAEEKAKKEAEAAAKVSDPDQSRAILLWTILSTPAISVLCSGTVYLFSTALSHMFHEKEVERVKSQSCHPWGHRAPLGERLQHTAPHAVTHAL